MASVIEANASADAAYELVQRAADWPAWSRIVAAVDVAPEMPWRAGARLAFRLRMARRVIPFNVRLTEVDPGRSVAWASTKFTITAVRTISFQAAQGDQVRTRIIDHKRFSSSLLPIGLAYPRGIIRRMTEAWLADLKAKLESGS